MKLTALILCLVPSIVLVSSGPSAKAMSAAKAQKKAGYVAYQYKLATGLAAFRQTRGTD